MKKNILLTTTILGICALSTCTSFGAGFGYLSAPTESNRNFAPLMQHQFEKQETLDFVNNSEDYKQKRERKEKFLDYQEGKVDVPQTVKTQYNLQNSRPGTSNLQFVKDENGNIKIQSIR